jgi:circadian clock protein KaiC
MSNKPTQTINRLATGVPGLDAILGGGLPEFSFTVISGSPGSGKTTLAHQIMFALATRERPALFFTALGEPPLKMLRYQQQFSFFDADKINNTVHFINLADAAAEGSYKQVLAHIAREVETFSPGLVFVDSFRSVMREVSQHDSEATLSLQQFIQQLGTLLSSWQASTFLVGEYLSEHDPHPVFTVADGLLSMEQNVYRNSMVRKMRVVKMRGQETRPGVHTFRITGDGVEIFPTALVMDDAGIKQEVEEHAPKARLSLGVPGLDDMMGGGLPSGYSMLIAGPSGSGKTILATSFLAEGVRVGEPGVIVAFEQTPSQSSVRTIHDMVNAGHIGLINTRSLDLSMEEIVHRLVEMIHKMNAKRVVIDSLSGFELAVAPSFRADFRESLFRMIAVLSNLGVTVVITSELEDRYTDLRFSPYGSAFLTDAIIVERYIEIESHLKRVMSVVKIRGSAHNKELRLYEITDSGMVIGKPLSEYHGLLSGQPTSTLTLKPSSVTIAKRKEL